MNIDLFLVFLAASCIATFLGGRRLGLFITLTVVMLVLLALGISGFYLLEEGTQETFTKIPYPGRLIGSSATYLVVIGVGGLIGLMMRSIPMGLAAWERRKALASSPNAPEAPGTPGAL